MFSQQSLAGFFHTRPPTPATFPPVTSGPTAGQLGTPHGVPHHDGFAARKNEAGSVCGGIGFAFTNGNAPGTSDVTKRTEPVTVSSLPQRSMVVRTRSS